MPSRPEMAVNGDTYSFLWGEEGIAADVDRVTESRDGMHAEVVIHSNVHGLLHAARLNLLSTQSRSSVAKALTERVALDWGGILEAMCFLTVERYREGEPAIDLATWEPDRKEHWLLYPYLSFSGPTVLFAEGMSGKSLLSLAMAYTVATGDRIIGDLRAEPCNVLYLDWETGPDTHWQRLRAIATPRFTDPPHIIYRYMTASLPESAGIIRKDIAKHHIRMVVVDSLGAAGTGAPEEASTAIALFQAIRTFKHCAVLCLHHKNKGGDTGGAGKLRLFGSAYYFNFARLVWELDAVHREGSDSSTVGMICHKNNYGRLFTRHAWEVRFRNDSAGEMQGVQLERRDVADVPELAGKMPLREQIVMELRHGAMSAADLTEALGSDVKQISSRLQDLKKGGRITRLEDGTWGLAAVSSR